MDERIAAMGQFLREELAAGRAYLPAGDAPRAFQRPLADVRVLVVGQDPYPTPGHPIGLSFAVDAHVRPLPRSLANIYHGAAPTTSASRRRAHGDLTAWADQGVMLLNRVLTVRPGEAGLAPRPGLGGGHRPCAIDALAAPRRPAAPRSCGAATPSRSSRCSARSRGSSRCTPRPLSATAGFFGSRPFSRGQPAARGAGRYAGRLVVLPRPGIKLNA